MLSIYSLTPPCSAFNLSSPECHKKPAEQGDMNTTKGNNLSGCSFSVTWLIVYLAFIWYLICLKIHPAVRFMWEFESRAHFLDTL